MANNIDEQLNRSLISIARSLIQYAGECWPWAGDWVEERQVVESVIRRQHQSVQKLTNLLARRGLAVDFGTYPDYSCYHYIALDFLLVKLVEVEAALIGRLERARQVCQDDSEASTLLEEVVAAEQENLKTLQELAQSHRAGLL